MTLSLSAMQEYNDSTAYRNLSYAIHSCDLTQVDKLLTEYKKNISPEILTRLTNECTHLKNYFSKKKSRAHIKTIGTTASLAGLLITHHLCTACIPTEITAMATGVVLTIFTHNAIKELRNTIRMKLSEEMIKKLEGQSPTLTPN
jgi:hypothetical protein